jgi:tRNA(Ile)-lysidine synthase
VQGPYVSGMSPTAVARPAGPLTVPFREHLAALEVAPARLLIAVSGGPDSVALLDLLFACAEPLGLKLAVGHVDHGIQPDTAPVAEAVRGLAAEYGLPFLERRLALGPGATETAARSARYRALEAMRRRARADLIATAHHADDQAETVLMRVLRGSGPAGLAAMASRRGRVLRPLLPFRRDDLARHLQRIGRSGWADPANGDPRHLRSWIRNDVLPALRGRLPDVEARLGRLAEQAAIHRGGWDALLDVLPGLDYQREADGASVASKALDIEDRKLFICIAIAVATRCGISLGATRAARIAELVQSGRSGSQVPLVEGWIAELSFDRVRFARPTERPTGKDLALAGGRGSALWCGWRFVWSPAEVPERQDRVAATAWLDPAASGLVVRARRAGDRIRPLGGRSRLLVRCFQDAKVPRSRRPGWPVLESQGSIVWVPGVCRSDLLVPRAGAEGLRVHAELA